MARSCPAPGTIPFATDNHGATWRQPSGWQGIVHFGVDSMRPGNALVRKACLELDVTHIENRCNLDALIGEGELRFIGLQLE